MSDRLERLRRLTELDPDDPLTHYGLALEYLKLERWDQAIAAFERTLQIDPNYSAAYYHKARAELGAARPDAAAETLRRGIEVARAAGDMKTEQEMRELLEAIPTS